MSEETLLEQAEVAEQVAPPARGSKTVEAWRDVAVKAGKVYPGNFTAQQAFQIACAFNGWLPKGHTISGKMVTFPEYEAGILAALGATIGGKGK